MKSCVKNLCDCMESVERDDEIIEVSILFAASCCFPHRRVLVLEVSFEFRDHLSDYFELTVENTTVG